MQKLWKIIHSEDAYHLCSLPVSLGLVTLDVITSQLPAGAYTTFRTYNHNKALRLPAHLNRLSETARLAGQPIDLQYDLIRCAIRQVISVFSTDQDLRIRLVLDLQENPGEVYLMAEYLKTPPAEAYINGVGLVTCAIRRKNPKAKLTRSILAADRVRQELDSNIEDALMVDKNGTILEGLTSNFFAIRDGQLWTNEDDVLSGITRSLVLDEARRNNLNINFEGIHIHKISTLNEAFITSSSRVILPVIQIDDHRVGSGKPGEITHRLMKFVEGRINREIESI